MPEFGRWKRCAHHTGDQQADRKQDGASASRGARGDAGAIRMPHDEERSDREAGLVGPRHRQHQQEGRYRGDKTFRPAEGAAQVADAAAEPQRTIATIALKTT